MISIEISMRSILEKRINKQELLYIYDLEYGTITGGTILIKDYETKTRLIFEPHKTYTLEIKEL